MWKIYLLRVPECDDQNIERVEAFLRDRRFLPPNKVTVPAKRALSLYGRLLLYYVLWREYDISNPRLKYKKLGKPRLVQPRGIHFNISHSGSLVALALGDSELGIDVESKRVTVNSFEIAQRHFCNDELDMMKRKDSPDDLFFIFWTLKESYLKCSGGSLAHLRTVPSFAFPIQKGESCFTIKGRSCYYALYDDFLLALCKKDSFLKAAETAIPPIVETERKKLLEILA